MSRRSLRLLQFLVVVFSLNVSVVAAEGFADKFRRFILETSADSGSSEVLPALPASSRSEDCMRCHDGSAARPVALKTSGEAMRIRGHRSTDHPVGMRYADWAGGSSGEFVSMGNLDPRIELEEGRVTCISCHETGSQASAAAHTAGGTGAVYGEEPQHCTSTNRLTTGGNQTSLCLSCHAL